MTLETGHKVSVYHQAQECWCVVQSDVPQRVHRVVDLWRNNWTIGVQISFFFNICFQQFRHRMQGLKMVWLQWSLQHLRPRDFDEARDIWLYELQQCTPDECPRCPSVAKPETELRWTPRRLVHVLQGAERMKLVHASGPRSLSRRKTWKCQFLSLCFSLNVIWVPDLWIELHLSWMTASVCQDFSKNRKCKENLSRESCVIKVTSFFSHTSRGRQTPATRGRQYFQSW